MKNSSATQATDPGRRRFLQGIGTGALALGGGSVLAAAGKSGSQGNAGSRFDGCDYDIAVIGGGFAGVTAARDCRENGYSTVILEARNRLGGRTFTSEFEGHRVELGGAWIHWSQPFVWSEKERYGLDIIETPGFAPDKMLLRLNGEAVELSEADVVAVMEAFSTYTAAARSVFERPFDTRHTWPQVLEADKISARAHLDSLDFTPLQRAAMDSLLASIAHNYSDQVSYYDSLRWSALAGYNDMLLWMDAVGRFKFRDGTSALIDKMIADGQPDVRLQTPIKRVEDLGDRVKITTNRGETLVAAAAVIALPMNVLNNVEFNPPLAGGVIEAAQQRHTGLGIKLYIRARGNLGKVFMMADSSHRLSNIFSYHEAEDHTILVAFGADPEALDMYDEAAVQDSLREFLPTAEVESTFGYDWVLDPYSQGTYASYRPGWMAKYYNDFQLNPGRLYFAQGDHGDGWRGFIDGAIGAGARAADRIAGRLG